MALCLSISGSTQNSNYSNTSVLDSDNDKSHLTQYIALNELKTITLLRFYGPVSRATTPTSFMSTSS